MEVALEGEPGNGLGSFIYRLARSLSNIAINLSSTASRGPLIAKWGPQPLGFKGEQNSL